MEKPAAAAPPYWTLSLEALLAELKCSRVGLTGAQASERTKQYGPNADASLRVKGVARAVIGRLFEPLSLILLGAGIISIATGDGVGGSIIIAILSLSIGLEAFQERQALGAAAALRQSVALRAEVRRDGAFVQVPVGAVVPGEIMRVRAGDIIPADGLVLESDAFTANEAALTGEPYPVEKRTGILAGLTAGEESNALFRGAASALAEASEVSPFQRDLHSYGLLTARLTIALVVVVLATSVFFGRPVLQSLMFAVALAVGLTPELLPMIPDAAAGNDGGRHRCGVRLLDLCRTVEAHGHNAGISSAAQASARPGQ